ncbi:hypothetical protein [robinz microvirus RP_56]|nr:hypothetical protein [robinz microvirus RP_56]
MDDVFKTTDKHNRFSAENKEILNPTPMQPPLGYKPQVSLVEQIRQQVRQLKHLDDTEPESEEDADDFEIEEDPILESRWENDMIPSIKETRARIRDLEAREKMYAKPEPVGQPDPAPVEVSPAGSPPKK